MGLFCNVNCRKVMVTFISTPLALRRTKKSRSRGAPISACDERVQATLGRTSTEMQKALDITSVGNLCLDIILPITSYPVRQGQHQALTSGARLELGGSLNALISASRLGAKAAHVAYIADQEPHTHPSDRVISGFVLDSATRLGLDTTAMVPRKGAMIPICAALSDPHGAHTFLATNEFPQEDTAHSEQDAPDCMLKTVARSKVLIVDGFALHSDRNLVSQTVRVALDEGVTVWLDPQAATASLLRSQDSLFQFIMDRAGGISLTAKEAVAITSQTDPLKAIEVIAKEHCPSATTFLLKDGANGSHIAQKGEGGDLDFSSVPGFTIDYKDSIGAGDSFLGAYLAGRIIHGFSTRDSARLANAMGAATCMNLGAGELGVGTHASVMQLLEGTSVSHKLRALWSEELV